MRSLSSALLQATPRQRDPAEAPRSLDSILRSFVEEGPRWRSRARRDSAHSDASEHERGSGVGNDPRDTRSSR